jgi:NitT/TauT family transport system ATP-binding protein
MDVYVEAVRHVWPTKSGQEFVAIENVTHHFRSGRFSCILGPSGCGKSTLMQIIGGLERATAGKVSLSDPQSPTLPRPQPSVMVWQNQNLFPWRTAIDNVAFGLEMRGLPRAERIARAETMLGTVGLHAFAHHYPRQLSGGMRQRVALARALIMERPILLMDEPFGSLDAQTKIVMQGELTRIIEADAKTIIFVTHAIDEAILLGDEVVVMTARPARIKEVIPVNLLRPRSPEMVNTPEFGALFDRVFHLIREEVTKSLAEQAASLVAAS